MTLHDLARVGVIVVDHGSRKAESNAMLDEFVELFKKLTRWTIIEAAHMEIAEPSISQAFDRCVAKGADYVVIVPYFLSRGRHVQQDIPQLALEAAEKHQTAGVKYVVAEPIGVDNLMVRLIDLRVKAALSRES